MSKIGVVTDSHSGILKEEADRLGIMVLPMPFFIQGECYYEGRNISRETFMTRLKNMEEMSTSQPSPEEVMHMWDDALDIYDQIIYIPISSGLSGACDTATGMALNKKYKDKVFVVDNGRVSTPMHRSVLDAVELVEQGCSASEIKERLEAAKAKMGIYVAVDDLKYLKRGGRISTGVAIVGEMLRVKPILKFDIGILDSFKNCRGLHKAKALMIAQVKEIMETVYPEEYARGDVHIVAASSAEKEETQKWIQEIEQAFPGREIMCDDLSFGVTCHIGPGGLGIGYSVRP